LHFDAIFKNVDSKIGIRLQRFNATNFSDIHMCK